ncbi:hypothetical protein LCR84_003803 [Salmonella enterica]|nr:hypothetical protein [Salmonella enterica]
MSMTTASITAGPAAAASVLSQTLSGLSVSAAVATMIHAGAIVLDTTYWLKQSQEQPRVAPQIYVQAKIKKLTQAELSMFSLRSV